jgi:hypothetical protein
VRSVGDDLLPVNWGGSMTVTTFYPDGHPETDSGDGRAENNVTNETWASIHDAASSSFASGTEASIPVQIQTDNTTDRWDLMGRGFFTFPTATLAATMEFRSNGKNSAGIAADSLSFVATTPASPTNVVTGDYNQHGSTKNSTNDIAVSSVTTDSSTAHVFTLNSTGLGNISKIAASSFGIGITSDVTDTEPSWVNPGYSAVTILMAEEAASGNQRPRLIVTHVSVFTPKVMMF